MRQNYRQMHLRFERQRSKTRDLQQHSQLLERRLSLTPTTTAARVTSRTCTAISYNRKVHPRTAASRLGRVRFGRTNKDDAEFGVPSSSSTQRRDSLVRRRIVRFDAAAAAGEEVVRRARGEGRENNDIRPDWVQRWQQGPSVDL